MTYILSVVRLQQKPNMVFERHGSRDTGSTMNTSALRTHVVLTRPAPATGALAAAVRTAARDFVAGLLSVTKAGLLSEQMPHPRLRRF